MTHSSGYSIAGYSEMITDAPRMDAYIAALEQSVRPGCVVLDIGAGTGIFSLLACRLGARRVYAVEPDDALQTAREIAAANGYADRIEFIQDISTRITLPERADVIISDLRGVLPLYQHHLPSIADARARLLAPGGVLIPRRDTLWAAVVESPAAYQRLIRLPAGPVYGFDMQPARRLTANTWGRVSLTSEALLAAPQRIAILDYTSWTDPDLEARPTWRVQRPGTVHGLLLWFDAGLSEGIGFSNAPGQPSLIYGQAFFPLVEPMMVEEGDTVSARLAANLVGDDYVWRWDTTILAGDDPARVKAAYRQSTFFSHPISLAQLRKQGAGYAPALDEEGHVRRVILDQMDGRRTVAEIARAVAAQFPDRFPDARAALTAVGDLSREHSR
jgi:protein arginine N-methyltransferase 1